MKKVLIVILIAVAAFCAVAAMQPDKFEVARSTAIQAPPAVVFEQVNDLQKWQAWSPWAQLDPNAKTTFEGPVAGVGAKMSWSGNSEVGEGTMTIVESRPNEYVKYSLEFKKPMAGVSESAFTISTDASGSAVLWTMNGTNNFIGKAISLIFNCEKMVGQQYEKGLANLKIIAEKIAADTAAAAAAAEAAAAAAAAAVPAPDADATATPSPEQ